MNRHEIQGTVISGPHAGRTANGQTTALITVETFDRFEEEGETVQEREAHQVIFFAKGAVSALNTLKQGDRIFVQGRQKKRRIGQDASGAIIEQLLHARLYWKIEERTQSNNGKNEK